MKLLSLFTIAFAAIAIVSCQKDGVKPSSHTGNINEYTDAYTKYSAVPVRSTSIDSIILTTTSGKHLEEVRVGDTINAKWDTAVIAGCRVMAQIVKKGSRDSSMLQPLTNAGSANVLRSINPQTFVVEIFANPDLGHGAASHAQYNIPTRLSKGIYSITFTAVYLVGAGPQVGNWENTSYVGTSKIFKIE